MRFRLLYYDTREDSKFKADKRYEYLGNAESIWQLWYILTFEQDKKHVEVYNLEGTPMRPLLGLEGMADYNP